MGYGFPVGAWAADRDWFGSMRAGFAHFVFAEPALQPNRTNAAVDAGDHDGVRYALQGGSDGFGFVCWRRSGDRRPSGQPMTARTLDELAERIDQRDAQVGKSADD